MVMFHESRAHVHKGIDPCDNLFLIDNYISEIKLVRRLFLSTRTLRNILPRSYSILFQCTLYYKVLICNFSIIFPFIVFVHLLHSYYIVSRLGQYRYNKVAWSLFTKTVEINGRDIFVNNYFIFNCRACYKLIEDLNLI